MNRKVLITAIVCVLGFAGILFAASYQSILNITDPETLKMMIKNPQDSVTIVDVRTPEEFADGHILNSVNIPLDAIQDSIATFRQYKNIVVVCRSGGRSLKAYNLLHENGFQNIYNGGGWKSLDEKLNEK